MKRKILYSTLAILLNSLLLNQSAFAYNDETVVISKPNAEVVDKFTNVTNVYEGIPIVDDPAHLPTALTVYSAVRVRAVGYATPIMYASLPPEQRRIMAIRASKSEALRALAEKIYGVKVNGLTTVSNMTLMRDSYDLTVDGLVRGANIVKADFLPDGTYKTVMEVQINRNLYERLMSQPYLSQYNAERYGPKVEKVNVNIQSLPAVPSNYYFKGK